MSSQKKLIVILGATASGKTSLAVQVAKELQTEVISFDSRQFFKEMKIGTAVPEKEELGGIKHHFIQHRGIHKPYSAGKFAEEAQFVLDDLFASHDNVVAVGGSGLYIDALVYGLDFSPSDKELREELNQKYEKGGLQALQKELEEKDPATYQEIDINNPVRVIRALEIITITGKVITKPKERKKTGLNYLPLFFSIELPREKLYDRINKRVDTMMSQGLLEEAKALQPYKNLTPLRTVGYSELFDYMDGKSTLEEAVELIKRNSRRYAKRQMTWVRRYPEMHYLSGDPFKDFLKTYSGIH